MSVTFICAVVAVLHPTTRLAGPFSFLILTTKDIVFPPSTSPSAQIEALAVNTSGVLLGLGWTNLGMACATFAGRRYGVDSSAVRAIKACFLVILASVSGLARSSLPRLAFASRAACFVGVWILSRTPITDEWDYREFTQLLFVCSVAGAASLVVSLVARIFTHPGGYPKDVIDALGRLKSLLELSTAQAFPQRQAPPNTDLCLTPSASSLKTITTSSEPPSQIEALQKSCLDDSLTLHGSYAYSAFELRIGRVPVKDIKPLLNTINRLREELAWGDRSKSPSSSIVPNLRKRGKADTALLNELDDPCRACALTIGEGLFVLQAIVGKCYSVKLQPSSNNSTSDAQTTPTPFEEPLSCRARIITVRAELKAKLDSAVHGVNQTRRSIQGSDDLESAQLPTQLFQKSLHATSLLHMSSELIRALTLAHAILEIHRTSRPRLFFLRPSWLWLGMSPRALVAEETTPSPPAPDEPDADVLSIEEANAVLPGGAAPTRSRRRRWWNIWNAPGMIRARIRLSRMIWSVKRSKHVKHAIKNALGVGLLVIPAMLPSFSPGKRYFDSNYGVWAIISFTYVLEPNTALTWRIGIWRLFGTTIGALYAYITWLIVRENPYGIVAFVTAAEIMLTWLVRSSTPGVGVVASVTIPPILFTPYLGLGHTSMIGLAALRGLQISIGIVAALAINHVVFPQHCRVLFLSGMAQVLDEVTGLYLHLSHRTLNNERARIKGGIGRSAGMELRIRELIARENVWLTQMEHEISLMPKPTRLYRASAESVQRIADLVSALRRIRENVPHEAIEQVLQYRQHVVSCVCIVLFACEHAFRSRRPLPQMLPSPRKALDPLTRELMEVLQDVPRATDIGYAVAEQEVREEMIEALEMLIEVTRALFGTSAWLEGTAEGAGSFGRSGVATPADIRFRPA
ncbi:hypothetical protein FRC09_015010 [Ceratobasidium sp. 395]|nr:hypothetical protein FRC09_015010 [Ceratobasidium sp. 395]